MTLRSGHSSQRISKASRNDEDREHLQEIAERRGILKWVRAVGIHETAAVGAQHLDGFLRGNRPLRDGLLSDRVHQRLAISIEYGLSILPDLLHLLRLDQFHRVIRLEILDHSL